MTSQSVNVKQLLQESAERKSESLRLYRPQPKQEIFHRMTNTERALIGGNRCLPGYAQIYDPVQKEYRRLDRIKGDFHVYAVDPYTGEQVIAAAKAPFVKGLDTIYRVTLESGISFDASEKHVVLTADYDWKSVAVCAEIRKAEGDCRLSDFPSRSGRTFTRDIQTTWNDIPETHDRSHWSSYGITRCEKIGEDVVYDFHVPIYNNYVYAGILHHNSGKSFASAAEFAHAATGIPIIGADGKPLPDKYDRTKPMILWCIGLGEDHIGQTLFRLLFTNSSGMRKIRDKETGEWRCYDPSNPDDEARKAESKPAGPLIPPRMIDRKGWAWENKALRVFEKCTLTNGNVIYAFSSRADAKQGDSVDLIWIDEDIADPGDYIEWKARILQSGGKIVWSAYPHCQNDALLRLNERAIKQEGTVRPVATRVVLSQADTKYISKQAQEDFLDGLTEDERRARVDGEFVMDHVMVYPSFSKYVHMAPAMNEELDDAFDHAIRQNNGEPMKNWTRYVIIDPGHTQAAVLFAAVPPPMLGNVVYLYDELYPKHMTAPEMARILYERLVGQEVRAFIMDWHAGRQTVMGYGKTIYQIYGEAFAKQQLRSTVTGSGFAQGSDNILGGIEIVRNMLKLQDHGRPVLRVNVDKCPNLCYEFSRYRKKVGKDRISDEPIQANNHLMDCLRYGVLYGLNYHLPTLDVTTGADKVWLSWWRQYGERAQREKGDTGIYVGAGAIA